MFGIPREPNRVSPTHDSGMREFVFEAQGVRLNYAVGPETGPPLVLIHGLGRSWHVFLPMIAALSLRWQIYAVDLRGHGKSSHVPRGYHGTEYSEDISAFLRERVGQASVLFGHSLGGMIGMWVAVHHPDLVRAVILGDSMLLSSKLPIGYPSLFTALRDLARKGETLRSWPADLQKFEYACRAPMNQWTWENCQETMRRTCDPGHITCNKLIPMLMI